MKLFPLILLALALARPALAQERIGQPATSDLMAPAEFKLLLAQPLFVLLPAEVASQPTSYYSVGAASAEAREAHNRDAAAIRAAWAAAAGGWPGLVPLTDEQLTPLLADTQQGYGVLTVGNSALTLDRVGRLEPLGFLTKTQQLSRISEHANTHTSTPYDLQPDHLRLAASLNFYTAGNFTQLYKPSDLRLALQQLRAYVQLRANGLADKDIDRAVAADMAASAAKLPQRILLLDQAQVAAGLTPEALAKAYPYPVQVVERAAIEQAAGAADARYVVLHFVPTGPPSLWNGNLTGGYQLADLATGQPLSYSALALKSKTLAGTITPDILRELTRRAGGR